MITQGFKARRRCGKVVGSINVFQNENFLLLSSEKVKNVKVVL